MGRRAVAGLVANPSLSGLAAAAAATLAPDIEAVVLWRQSVQCFHEAHLPFDTAESRLGLAAVLVRTGDLAGAREQLAAATQLLESLGAGGVLEEAGRLGLAVHSAADRNGTVLSDRETEVLRLVAEGRTNQQIADALVLSPHTVHRHVAHILAKLDRPTRAGAAAYAISAGLLGPPHPG